MGVIIIRVIVVIGVIVVIVIVALGREELLVVRIVFTFLMILRPSIVVAVIANFNRVSWNGSSFLLGQVCFLVPVSLIWLTIRSTVEIGRASCRPDV